MGRMVRGHVQDKRPKSEEGRLRSNSKGTLKVLVLLHWIYIGLCISKTQNCTTLCTKESMLQEGISYSLKFTKFLRRSFLTQL